MKTANIVSLSLLFAAGNLLGIHDTQPTAEQTATEVSQLTQEKSALEKSLKEAQSKSKNVTDDTQKKRVEQNLATVIEKAHSILTESLSVALDKLTTRIKDRINTPADLYETFNQYQVSASLLLLPKSEQAIYRTLKNAIEALIKDDSTSYKKLLKDFDALLNKRADTLKLVAKLKAAQKFLEAEKKETEQEKLQENRKRRTQDEKEEEQREKDKQAEIDEPIAREKEREKRQSEDTLFEMERWAYRQGLKEKEAAEIAEQQALDAASKASEL
jgi:type I site-specific restriction-modification system R (restriction) subunit